MRRMLLTSLVLLPMIAQAQAGVSGEKSSTLAALTLPSTPMAAAASSAVALTTSLSADVIQENIRTRTVDDFASTRAFDPIPRNQISAPDLKTASAIGFAPEELAKQPAVIKVVLNATIDTSGVPHNISVSHSGGAAIDQKAVAAVSEYRFQPAMIDHRATESSVSIEIKIKK